MLALFRQIDLMKCEGCCIINKVDRIRLYYFKEEYMPESLKTFIASLLQRNKLFVMLIAVVVLLGFGYVSGYFIFPNMIKSAYDNKDCQSVLSRGHTYKAMYPPLSGDGNTSNMVMECAVYTLAVLNQDEKNWLVSYNAFSVYSETYPEGMYFKDVREYTAVVLTNLAEDEMEQNKYAEAFVNVDLVLMNFTETEVIPEAEKLKANIYTKWGARLRDSGDFIGAEGVFKEFQNWAKNHGDDGYTTPAQLEISKTYLMWGLALQSQKNFDDAKTKFDVAMSTDPLPTSDSGPSAQVKANQEGFYIDWGDYYVEQNSLDAAITKYEAAVSLAGTNESKNALVKGYLAWGKDLSGKGDFLGALDYVDISEKYVVNDAAKKPVDDARSNIYVAFSQSSGEQALNEMQKAVQLICEQHKPPEIPIFGLDNENVLADIFGVDEKLTENVRATTPGSLHYVVCVDKVDSETIQFENFYNYFLYRIREDWTVNLRDVITGDVVETHTIKGANPQPLPTNPYEIAQGGRSQSYFGRPDMSELADWLLTVMK